MFWRPAVAGTEAGAVGTDATTGIDEIAATAINVEAYMSNVSIRLRTN